MATRSSVVELAAYLERSFSGKVSLGVPDEQKVDSARLLRTGLPEIDRVLGGLPRGRISELVGRGSSGKLSLLLSLLREVMDRDSKSSAGTATSLAFSGLAALVDLSGTIFPGDSWATGRLLVVRPRTLPEALRSLDILLSAGTLEVLAFEATGVDLPGAGVPEAVLVRLSRLARESGTALVSCACRSLFGGSASLRLALEPGPSGELVARAGKNRQGPLGTAVLARPGVTGWTVNSSSRSRQGVPFLPVPEAPSVLGLQLHV